MTKLFCDACGEEITQEDELLHQRIELRESSDYPWRRIDLHKNCWEELLRGLRPRYPNK